MPSQIASRDDVTLAQKQRLAVLAKMGVGPVASASPVVRDVPPLAVRDTATATTRVPPPMDRKAALLEQERRFREQEERQQEMEAREEQEKREKRARIGKGLARLGPVMPREDDIPQFLPAPMQVPPSKTETRMEIKISKETAERAKGLESANAKDDDDEEDDQPEDQVLAFLRMEKAKKAKTKPTPQEEQNAKPGKKKRKRTRGREGEGEEWYAEEDYAEDEVHEDIWEREHFPVRARDGGVSKQMMVVESVKGKVSTANRNFTDADLERRFSMQENQGHGSLMTEEEVLRMIKKEKQERGGAATGSASRRVQRELAEWAAAKEQQRARVKSPHRFERMVVSRK